MELDYKKRVRDNNCMNWKTLIQNLIDHGLTQAQIADRCNTGQSYISDLYRVNRKCPNWHLGESLRKLHLDVCGYDPFTAVDSVADSSQKQAVQI